MCEQGRAGDQRDIRDRALYDLMINSDVGIDRAASAILDAAGLDRQENTTVALAS